MPHTGDLEDARGVVRNPVNADTLETLNLEWQHGALLIWARRQSVGRYIKPVLYYILGEIRLTTCKDKNLL